MKNTNQEITVIRQRVKKECPNATTKYKAGNTLNILLRLSMVFFAVTFFYSCSSVDFMKRKYMPGYFFDKPVSYSSSHTETKKPVSSADNSRPRSEGIIASSSSGLIIPVDNSIDLNDFRSHEHSPFLTQKANPEKIAPDHETVIKKKSLATRFLKSDHKRKGMAWLSLIFGILTFYPLVFSSVVAALLAIIFGMIAIRKANNDSADFGGKGIAFLGICLGVIGVALVLLGVIAAL